MYLYACICVYVYVYVLCVCVSVCRGQRPGHPHGEPGTQMSVPHVNFTRPPSSVIAAAAAAKSLQSCPTLCDPIDGSPPGSPFPGILQARALEWVVISFSNA